jgi:hypothetical protein
MFTTNPFYKKTLALLADSERNSSKGQLRVCNDKNVLDRVNRLNGYSTNV